MLPVMEDSLLLLNQEGNSPLHVACQMLVNQMPKQDFYQQCMENILEYGKRRRKGMNVKIINVVFSITGHYIVLFEYMNT